MVTAGGRVLGIAAACCAAVAFAAPAIADEPGYYGYYGTSDEYPVGMCIDVTNNIEIDADELKNNIPVPCTDPARDMRVVEHVDDADDCTQTVYEAIPTTDGVVLCVVQDYT